MYTFTHTHTHTHTDTHTHTHSSYILPKLHTDTHTHTHTHTHIHIHTHTYTHLSDLNYAVSQDTAQTADCMAGLLFLLLTSTIFDFIDLIGPRILKSNRSLLPLH
jgi:hypothetical protein